MLIQTIPQETEKVYYPTIRITSSDMVEEYGKKAEKQSFCKDCIDYDTCQGIKWATCPYRKEFIRNEARNVKEVKSRRVINKWTTEEKEKTIKMLKTDMTYKEIGKVLNRSASSVYVYVRNYLPEYFKPSSNLTNWTEYDHRIVSMKKEGKTTKEIAKVLGINYFKLQYHMKSLKGKNVIENKDYRERR